MKNLLSLCAFLYALTAFSQPGQHFYGGSGRDLFHHIVPAPDGNYFLLGAKAASQREIWLLKVSPGGAVIWEQTYAPSSLHEYGNRLLLLDDGNILILGQQLNHFTDEGAAVVIKTDAEGNQLWKQVYDNTLAAFDAVPHGDNFLVVGWYGESFDKSGLLMEINGAGELQWRESINISSDDVYIKRIFPTADGSFLIAGRVDELSSGYVFLHKIAPDGQTLWKSKDFIGSAEHYAPGSGADVYPHDLGAVQVADGSIWMTETFGRDVTLVHFSSEGELLDKKTYVSYNWQEFPNALTSLPDGGWLVTGVAVSNTISDTELHNGFALRTDNNGLEVWKKYYGLDDKRERLFSSVMTPDGGFLMAGMSNVNANVGSTVSDGWLLRTESDGNLLPWRVNGKVIIDTNGNCIADPGEPPAAGWFVNAENGSEQALMTDAAGNFTLRTPDGVTNFTVKPPALPGWTICNNNQSVTNNAASPVTDLIFVAQQADGNCPLTEVSITQPDLVRCSTSRFFATVHNRGLEATEDLELRVELHPDLSVVSASAPFNQNGNELVFELSPISALQSVVVEIRAALACEVPLGTSHPVIARISPVACVPSWTGPKYEVKGSCDGTTARFELQNAGGGPDAVTRYRVKVNDLLATDWTDVTLAAGGAAQVLSFPADGRTWRVELEQAPGYPQPSHPAAMVEGCGTAPNLLYSTGYLNTWRPDDDAPDVSWALPANTTEVPNKVAAVIEGVRLHNLHGDLRPIEFTVRARNPLPHPAQKVIVDLTFSPALDVTTFRLLSANALPAAVSVTENKKIRIILENLQLDTGAVDQADALLRFVIAPFSDTPADALAASYLNVYASVYFNEAGPFSLSSGTLSYSHALPVETEECNYYPPEIDQFGGRYFTHGTNLAQAEDGAVFLAGQSNDYSAGTNGDVLLIKTNPYGKVLWLNALDISNGDQNQCEGVVPLDDGGCLVIGDYYARSTFHNYPYVARVDASGRLLWHKKIQVEGLIAEAWADGIQQTTDGHFVLFGHAQNDTSGSIRQFYLKLNTTGDILWQHYPDIEGFYNNPKKTIPTPDGGFVMTGQRGSSSSDNIFLKKISSSGDSIWRISYQLENIGAVDMDWNNFYSHVAPAADGGYMVACVAAVELIPNEYSSVAIFIKFNTNGVFEWEKRVVIDTFSRAGFTQFLAAPGGGFLAGGTIYKGDGISTPHNMQLLLMKVDENANLLWLREYGNANTEWPADVLISAPDRILFWGSGNGCQLQNNMALLIHTDLQGNLTTDTKEQPTLLPFQAVVFPNPASSVANVVLSPAPSGNVDWMVVNLSGQVVQRGNSANGLFAIDTTPMAAGLYVVAFPGSRYAPQRLVVSK